MTAEIIGDDYPTYEESVNLTLAEKAKASNLTLEDACTYMTEVEHEINKQNIENYKKSGKIYVNNVEKIVETLLAIIDLLKLVLTNKNDDNIDHDHYLINEEIKLDERI